MRPSRAIGVVRGDGAIGQVSTHASWERFQELNGGPLPESVGANEDTRESRIVGRGGGEERGRRRRRREGGGV